MVRVEVSYVCLLSFAFRASRAALCLVRVPSVMSARCACARGARRVPCVRVPCVGMSASMSKQKAPPAHLQRRSATPMSLGKPISDRDFCSMTCAPKISLN